MEEKEAKKVIEKVLGVKYCLAYVFRKYVEHNIWCEKLYCCDFCPDRCHNPICSGLSLVPSISKPHCSRDYEVLMVAVRRFKWMKRVYPARNLGYISYSEMVKVW